MKWHERLTTIDRRIIYGLLTIFVIVPFFIPLKLRENIMPQTKRLFDFMESIPPHEKAVIISFDYTPSTYPECHPMAVGLLRQCFKRKIPVVGMSFDPQGPGMAVDAIDYVVAEINRAAIEPDDSAHYGIDYVYLGYKAGFEAAILEMGENIANVFPRDHLGTPVESLPLMARTKNYKDIAIALIITAAAYPDWWVLYAQSRYGVKVAAGLTAVMAAEFYPYLQTGQFTGMLSGMKGAAEYEELMLSHNYTRELGKAERGMNSQSMIHILIIAFIIIGNIGYFLSRRKK